MNSALMNTICDPDNRQRLAVRKLDANIESCCLKSIAPHEVKFGLKTALNPISFCRWLYVQYYRRVPASCVFARMSCYLHVNGRHVWLMIFVAAQMLYAIQHFVIGASPSPNDASASLYREGIRGRQ